MKKLLLFVAIIAVVLGALYWGKHQSSTREDSVSGSTLELSYDIEGLAVVLKNGRAEMEAAPGSAMKITTQYFGNEVHGDLNGDGMSDVVFLLTQNSGGTGTFYYVVAAIKTSSGYQGTNAILLGDRIAPQTTEIRNGEVLVNYADRKEGEPFSAAPSVGITKTVKIESGRLVEVQ